MPLKTADSVNQNTVQVTASQFCTKYGISTEKAASFQPATHKVLIKTNSDIRRCNETGIQRQNRIDNRSENSQQIICKTEHKISTANVLMKTSCVFNILIKQF